ncbi:protein phosphatase [Massilia violaceinigra]|uniref:Protein phosphatase n=1 Tax=Massilia violaceinigra TaxID=2045208 RepID=A0A2D2DN15_9BURK|nr:PP2C family serine/threonine-protein phosphatase [Massilia violaceinigra]ATQ76378.1 protein phosphatase [Massilia violaceinigra]
MLTLTTAQCSHRGSRTSNEDALGFRVRDNDACFVISDGVGGQAGGAIASRLAVHWALQQLDDKQSVGLQAMTHGSVDAADAAIVAEQRRNPERARMAATMVALFIDRRERMAQWIHVGDSRLYLFRRGHLVRRTQDHSLASQLQQAGLSCSPDKAHLLSHALGQADTDTIEPGVACTLEDGDAYLLCTDGLWNGLDDAAMHRCLQVAGNVTDWITLLAEQVRQRSDCNGTQDNYSALGVWVGDPQLVTRAHGG